jgi:hypothetical protein
VGVGVGVGVGVRSDVALGGGSSAVAVHPLIAVATSTDTAPNASAVTQPRRDLTEPWSVGRAVVVISIVVLESLLGSTLPADKMFMPSTLPAGGCGDMRQQSFLIGRMRNGESRGGASQEAAR